MLCLSCFFEIQSCKRISILLEYIPSYFLEIEHQVHQRYDKCSCNDLHCSFANSLIVKRENCGKNRHLQYIYAFFTHYLHCIAQTNAFFKTTNNLPRTHRKVQVLVLNASNSKSSMKRGKQKHVIWQTEFYCELSHCLSVIQGFCFSIRLFSSSL